MQRIRVAVAGAKGRMGGLMAERISNAEGMELVAAFDPRGGYVEGLKVSHPDEMEKVLDEAAPDVFVDFTNADAAVKNVKTAAGKKIKLVVGTTGFTQTQFEEMREAIERNGVPAVISPNFSIGVNVFWKLVAYAVKFLSEYHVEIVEMHHALKKDAPSGTALKAAEIVAQHLKSLGKECKIVHGRIGLVGERSQTEIGIHAIRAGDVVGEHTVIFATKGERLEITHRAQSREAFANGAMLAIQWVAEQSRAGIYSMDDVLSSVIRV